MSECTPPAFDATGQRFLLVEGEALSRWDADSMTRVGAIEAWPWSDDDGQGDSFAWAGPDRALVQTNESRLYLVDLLRGCVESEVGVAGHGPRPIGEIWPSLAKEGGVSSDLSHFLVGPSGRGVSVHDVETAGSPEGARLVAWDVKGLP